MKLKYNIRLLVQYVIEADSFNEAMLRASRNVMPNNGDAVQWHYVGKNEKRYVFDYHDGSLMVLRNVKRVVKTLKEQILLIVIMVIGFVNLVITRSAKKKKTEMTIGKIVLMILLA
jgi:hypothetical protein